MSFYTAFQFDRKMPKGIIRVINSDSIIFQLCITAMYQISLIISSNTGKNVAIINDDLTKGINSNKIESKLINRTFQLLTKIFNSLRGHIHTR